MKIIIAPNSGFCFGVKKAVDKVYRSIESGNKVHTLGPVIHNPQVIADLEEKGVLVVEDIDDIEEGTVIIRSHGVGHSVYERLQRKGLDVIDATCPFVKRIHNLVHKYWDDGYDIIIVGESSHPEVIGINGWCNNEAHIVYSKEDIDGLPSIDKACVVAQTTIIQGKWNELISVLTRKISELQVFDTICNATHERQREARELAKKVDTMLVIGGKNSSNTQKLYQLCKKYCKNTFAIETAEDINKNMLDASEIIGVTAGASTPNWLIEEVVQTMDKINKENTNTDIERVNENNLDINNEEVETTAEEVETTNGENYSMDDFEDTLVTIKTGQTVTGTVLSVSSEEVIVNIGYKSDGIISKNNLLLEDNQELSDAIEVGEEIKAIVTNLNDGEGNVILSQRQLKEREAWETLEAGHESQKEFKGKCVEAVKGGVIAVVEGLKAFVPASHISTRYIENLETIVGQDMRLRIIEIDRRKNRLVASQKDILEEERKIKEEALWNTIEEGQKMEGVVKNIVSFGAFVDIGGVDGLVHISDLAWTHVEKPEDVLSVGDNIEVVILSADRERERISLGYKQLLPHPWDNVEQKYTIGSIITGVVSRITDFGAFIELEPGVDGLVHISQISEEHVNKVEDYLSAGEEVNVKVLNVDADNRRISLSIKEALLDSKAQEKKPQVSEPENESLEDPALNDDDMMVSMSEFFPKQFDKDEE